MQKVTCRSSHRRSSVRKDFLKNVAIFIGKHLCWSVFSIKKGSILKRLQHRCFPVNFAKFLGTSMSKKISKWLPLNLDIFGK